jgi:hypothetical protein
VQPVAQQIGLNTPPASPVDGACWIVGTSPTGAWAGQVLRDFARGSFSLDLQGITLTASVSAAGTVSVRFQNGTAGAIDLGSDAAREGGEGLFSTLGSEAYPPLQDRERAR